MDNLINFLIDFLFYGFIDALVLCFMAYTINYKKLHLKEIMAQAAFIDVIICLISVICPFTGYSQILMALSTAAFFILYNKEYSIIKYIKYCAPILIMSVFEFISTFAVNGLLNSNLLSEAINSFYRISCYTISKVLQIIIFCMWRRLHMKVVLGGIVRR